MNEYWARKPLEPGIHFYTPAVMSRDRYLSIMKFLRFSTVNEVDKKDSSTRLNTFCDMLTDISMKNVDAGEHIAIDEALVLWKGRLHFRQFIRTKRARFGIKLFVMCNSEKDWAGYNWNFCVYYGKDRSIFPQSLDVTELSKSEKIVAYLAQSVLGQGRHIIVDNWYSSVRLASFLEQHNTLVTGTIRSNRGLPKELIDEKLQRHQFAFVRKENMLLVKWEDKNTVHVISTKYTAGVVEKDKKFFGGYRQTFKKPVVIEKYNEFMGGVDKADQLLEPYDPSRKSHAWFKKLGLHLIMRMVLNSFLVYKNKVNKQMTLRKYIVGLVEELITKHSKDGKSVFDKYVTENPRSGHKRKHEEVVHALVPIQQAAGTSKKNPTKRCRVCYPKRKDTRTCCIGCPDTPGLCSIEHFQIFHRRSDE